MSEFVIFPEMLSAGVEALVECRKRDMEEGETCLAIFMAMQGVYAMQTLRGESELLH